LKSTNLSLSTSSAIYKNSANAKRHVCRSLYHGKFLAGHPTPASHRQAFIRPLGPADESRHTFITNLALTGVNPAVAQKLDRYFSIELTTKYYTYVLHKSEVSAIE